MAEHIVSPLRAAEVEFATRLIDAVQRLLILYTATGNAEELEKWTHEKAKLESDGK